jgi:flagellar basal body rod protein FlgC
MTAVMHVSPAPALSSAARGLSDAERRMDTAAANVANVADDPTDLTSDLIDATVLAPVAYGANAAVIRAADEAQRSLLDIRA